MGVGADRTEEPQAQERRRGEIQGREAGRSLGSEWHRCSKSSRARSGPAVLLYFSRSVGTRDVGDFLRIYLRDSDQLGKRKAATNCHIFQCHLWPQSLPLLLLVLISFLTTERF